MNSSVAAQRKAYAQNPEQLPRNTRLLAALWVVAAATAWAAQHWLAFRLQPAGIPTWLWVLLGAPLLEEWVLRRWVQSSVHGALQADWPALHGKYRLHIAAVQRWAAQYGAAALATTAFAAAHAPAHGWRCVWWLLPGWALAEVWRRSGSLLACVVTHAWFNLCLALSSRWA